MSLRCLITLLVLLNVGVRTTASEDEAVLKGDRHIEVSMRMIGHQVLLATGDSTSLVLPVEKNGDQYLIQFNTEFEFDPDSIANVIDSVIAATGISKNYVVEFAQCDSVQTVYAYEVGEDADVLACRGRRLPVACYDLFVTLLDSSETQEAFSEPMVFLPQEEAESDNTMLILLVVIVVIMLGVILFLISQKSGKNEDPHVIKIGEFLFNKHSMELTFKDDKVELTGKEADLLNLLSSSANETVDRDEILKEVWGDEGDYVGRTLDVFISKLRKKLEADDNVKIINIRGIGYKLVLGDRVARSPSK